MGKDDFELRIETGSEHFAYQDSGFSQIFQTNCLY